MGTVTIVTTRNENGEVLENFLSTCPITPKTLYYNTGNGYATASCINARGNQSFDSSSAGSRPLKDDYYVGTGGPAEAAVSAAVQASELVGRHIGKVEKTYRGVTTDITSDGTNPVVVTSATYTCDGRLFTSENVNKGTISGLVGAPWRDSNGDPITQSITYVTSGSTTATLTVISGPASARAVPKTGWKFDGWYVNGTKVTATSSASNIYVSPSSPYVLKVRADYRQDVSAEARFVEDPSVYLRWSSTCRNATNGHEWMNTYRISTGTSGTSLRKFAATETTKLSEITHSKPNRWGSSPYYANYFPYDDGSGWAGRTVGAKREGKVLAGWRLTVLLTDMEGTVLGGILPPDASTTIAEIAGRFEDAGVPLTTSTNYANYWLGLLTGVWGAVDTSFEEEQQGDLDGQTPTVEWTSEATADGAKVTVTAQTENLGEAEFKRWRATGVDLVDLTNPVAEFTMLEGDVSLTAVYGRIEVAVSHSIDAASTVAVAEGAGTSVTDSEGQAVITPQAKDVVVFHAPPPKDADKFAFDGWYVNGADAPASTSLNFQVTLGGDIAVVAKYATAVTVAKFEGGGTGTVAIDGVPAPAGAQSATEFRRLGSRVEISAVAASGFFGGWKVDGAASALYQTATVDVDAPHLYEAQFLASVQPFTVTCQSEKAKPDEEGEAGTLALAPAEGVTDNGDGTYGVSGFRAVSLVVAPSASSPLPLRGVFLVETIEGETVETQIDVSEPVPISRDTTFLARWGAKDVFDISVESEDDSEGIAFLGDTAGTTSVSVEDGSMVTATALPSNGFSFAGWFIRSDGEWSEEPVSRSARYSFKASRDVALQARFEDAVAAVCVWEGSDENKTMEWTSKVYTLPKPFDPVAARVDATGYPVDLIVRTYSSPDKSNPLPVRDHELTSQNPLAVQSQDGRRLPRMRPERFMRVSVESTHEVDAIVVGTNMAEVN